MSPGIYYVHEPFHINPRNPANPFRYWFEYIHCGTEPEKLAKVESYIRALPSKGRVLVKDPIALISAPWLAQFLNAEVLITVRHPAAFAGSLKVANWTHPFEHFDRQETLMKTFLSPFRDQVKSFAERKRDIIDQAILLWNILYYAVHRYRQQYPDWVVVRHEDISRNPVGEFQGLFERFGLFFSESTAQQVLCSTSGSQQSLLARNAVENIHSWKERLTRQEILRIRKGTEQIAGLFYGNEEWD